MPFDIQHTKKSFFGTSTYKKKICNTSVLPTNKICNTSVLPQQTKRNISVLPQQTKCNISVLQHKYTNSFYNNVFEHVYNYINNYDKHSLENKQMNLELFIINQFYHFNDNKPNKKLLSINLDKYPDVLKYILYDFHSSFPII